ncbi:MAG: heavy metal translocating P-type ATPase [Planctomycetota bacterium]
MTTVASGVSVGAGGDGVALGTSCAHCGLPVPSAMRAAGREEQFCCTGCEAARAAILGCGLDRYYEMREGAEPVGVVDDRYAALDDPAFAERYVTAHAGGLCESRLCLQGVHCVACLWLLEKLPRHVAGLVSLELDLGRSVAVVRWDAAATTLSSVARSLARFGYPPHPVEPSEARSARSRSEKRQLAELGAAAALMGNVMLLAFALYSGEIEPTYERLFRWLSAGLGIASVAWPGRVFFRGAWAALRARSWHLDAPIAIALAVGSVAGLVNVVRGSGEIYFDSLTMLVLLLLIGRWLQARQQHRATEAVELLFSLTPRSVRRVEDDGSVREVPAEAVSRGDLVEVLAERSVPVDGVIESGRSRFDESALTGESAPIERGDGDTVAAGTTNLSSVVRVRVTASGRETRIGRILETVERLSRSRVPLIGSAERLAKPFVLTVVGLGLVCLVVHTLLSGVETAVEHTVALVIVVCPCAVSIATPLATSFAIGRLATRGILVKGGDVLEALAGSPAVVFDKTGTLTDGRFAVRETVGDASVWGVVAAAEAGVAHPVGRALARLVKRGVVDDGWVVPESVEVMSSRGVVAVAGGDEFVIGSKRLMRERGIAVDAWERLHGGSAVGARVLVARNGELVAEARLGDATRPESAASLSELRGFGWEASLASGDAPEPVARVADELGLGQGCGQAAAGVTPEGKRAMVEALRAGDGGSDADAGARDRRVVFVGDGVNDAAALAAADVGVAVHGGAEASMAAADVYLNRGGLGPLVELVRAARGVTSRVRWCLGLAATYNALAAGLALAGLVSPVVAAVLMPVSSLTVFSIAVGGGRRGLGRSEGA